MEIVDKEKQIEFLDKMPRCKGPQADFIRLKIKIRDLFFALTDSHIDYGISLDPNFENFIFRVIETFHLEDAGSIMFEMDGRKYFWRSKTHLTFDRDDNKNGGETYSILCGTFDHIKTDRGELLKSFSEIGRLPEKLEHQLIDSLRTINIRPPTEDVAFASDVASIPNKET